MYELNIGGSNMTVELDGNTLAATANTGNKQWVAVITDTHPKYNYDRDFVAYQKPKTADRDSGTATVEDGAVIERVRYTHSGKNRTDRFYQLVNGEVYQIDEAQVTAALDGEIVPDIEEESHECEKCGDEFDSERGLAIHQGMVHDNSDHEESEDTEEATMTESNTDNTSATAMTDGGTDTEPVADVLEGGINEVIVRTLSHGYRFTKGGSGDDVTHVYCGTVENDQEIPIGDVPSNVFDALEDAGHSPNRETTPHPAGRDISLVDSDSSDGTDDDGGSEPIADGGTEEIRDYRSIEHSDDGVRSYSADGHLYAYRDGDEHVVVSRGNEPGTRWTERVPAEREAVLAGEHLWTVPENWEHRVNIRGVAEARYAIYHIPETGVDVLVTVPNKNYLVDAWYGVKRVGSLAVTYDDEIAWDELETLIENVRDIEEVSDDVVEALETLHSRRRGFERKFAEDVDMHAEDALFVRAHEPVLVHEWTADPWGDIFHVDFLVQDFLDLDNETRDAVLRELSEGNVIPHYPTVRVDVEDGEGVPEGYDIRALVEAGASGAETIDYLITEHYDQMTQTDWAEIRSKGSSAISKNVSGAKGELSD